VVAVVLELLDKVITVDHPQVLQIFQEAVEVELAQ
jgi:hypothetical protein